MPKREKTRPLVLVSRPLALEKDDPLWKKLERLARVVVRPVGARQPLASHPELARAAAVVTMVDDRVDAALLAKAPFLRVVANHAVGTNNVDLVAARKRGIVVANTPDVLTNATAELTISLLLAAARRFEEGTRLLREDAFTGWHPRLLLGRELKGARLGIVGQGRIGRAVAAKARALGMKVAYSNRRSGVKLEKLLRDSDFVSLHCPLTAETRNLIGRRELALMKPGSFLINTARGEIVDEKALLTALGKNLRGAAIDVFHREPRLDARLARHPRVFVLPHLGSATIEARAGMARLAVGAVIEVLSGRIPANRVR
ncbi:MAG: D-glycerate dehydrogenase [Deltaproteobacteria bacterium]|nr:D-glycerate dehydrogenase [Deltaproteobacteria bacterium]